MTDDPFPFKIDWPYTVHELKTVDPYFDAVNMGDKTFEIRRDDRHFQPGDLLVLRHYVAHSNWYSGAHCERVVSYVMRNAPQYGVADGFAVLGLRPPPLGLKFTVLDAAAVSR